MTLKEATTLINDNGNNVVPTIIDDRLRCFGRKQRQSKLLWEIFRLKGKTIKIYSQMKT